jgi:hypothetical protein
MLSSKKQGITHLTGIQGDSPVMDLTLLNGFLGLCNKKNIINYPITGLTGPWGSRRLRLPEFLDNRHLKVVRLTALCTGLLYPQEGFLVFISVRG